MLQEKGEEEGGQKGIQEGSSEGRAADGERNFPQLDVVGAVRAKTGETPRQNRTSPELALPLQTYTCNFLPNCFKASIITKIKRTPPSSVTKEYH